MGAKTVCKTCRHHKLDNERGVWYCKKQGTRTNDYGAFKEGAWCKHDPDLRDLYEPIVSTADMLEEWKAEVVHDKKLIMELRRQVHILQSRLINTEET